MFGANTFQTLFQLVTICVDFVNGRPLNNIKVKRRFFSFLRHVFIYYDCHVVEIQKNDFKHLISKCYNQTNIFGECSRKELFKGISDPNEYFFEIDVGQKRIRHSLCLVLPVENRKKLIISL